PSSPLGVLLAAPEGGPGASDTPECESRVGEHAPEAEALPVLCSLSSVLCPLLAAPGHWLARPARCSSRRRLPIGEQQDSQRRARAPGGLPTRPLADGRPTLHRGIALLRREQAVRTREPRSGAGRNVGPSPERGGAPVARRYESTTRR